MSDCLYPHNTGQTAYWKGCRCERCREAKRGAEVGRKQHRRFACVRCGVPVWRPNAQCKPCLYPDYVTRVVDKITISESGCWIYTGTLNKDGYGMTANRHGSVLAHRVTYTHYVGPVPEGLYLDHLCRVRECCNPDHLEAVTAKENVRRSRRCSP